MPGLQPALGLSLGQASGAQSLILDKAPHVSGVVRHCRWFCAEVLGHIGHVVGEQVVPGCWVLALIPCTGRVQRVPLEPLCARDVPWLPWLAW